MLRQVQKPCRPDGALKMVCFYPATKISPLRGFKIAMIFQIPFQQIECKFKRNPPEIPLDPQYTDGSLCLFNEQNNTAEYNNGINCKHYTEHSVPIHQAYHKKSRSYSKEGKNNSQCR